LRWLGYCGGCFIYVRRDAFEQVDGFDESLFAGEEVQLMKALQQVGRVTVVREPVITSGRKVRRFSLSTLMRLMFRIVFRGRPAVSKREGLEVWYDGVREPFAAHERPAPHNG
jgi:GT2 family glycosyltransferase